MFRTRFLQGTALVIAVVQFGFGLAYLPAWTGWPFGLLGARFLALGFGMMLVARNPTANRGWIQAMIFVQAVDWFVVVISLLRGVVTLAQVAVAPYLPIVFIVCLLIAYPRQSTESVPVPATHSER
jgi:hypothetical protein